MKSTFVEDSLFNNYGYTSQLSSIAISFGKKVSSTTLINREKQHTCYLLAYLLSAGQKQCPTSHNDKITHSGNKGIELKGVANLPCH